MFVDLVPSNGASAYRWTGLWKSRAPQAASRWRTGPKAARCLPGWSRMSADCCQAGAFDLPRPALGNHSLSSIWLSSQRCEDGCLDIGCPMRRLPEMMRAMWTHLLFLLFVALAVYAQNVTGFALALILLGLVGATDLLPLPDAVNAVMVMVMVLANAGTFLYHRRPLRFEPSLWPAVASGVLGAVAGILLLTWLAAAAYQVLRLLLGLSIVTCALLLWHASRPQQAISSRIAFVLAGGVAGLLGGMFAAPGPPLVYLMYRQPLSHARIQEVLILFFGISALLRLVIIVPAGQFSLYALQLTAEAIPVVYLVTSFAARRPPPLPPKLLKSTICLLLIATGAGMVGAALSTTG
jgi:uncharacterized membrane protein YfcA